jgi:hypothetical protein
VIRAWQQSPSEVRSKPKAEQELKEAVEFRAQLMRQIDGQNFAFDA